MRSRMNDHVTLILQELHRVPDRLYAQFKVLVMNYKALYRQELGYLKGHLVHYVLARPLTSTGEAPPGSLHENEATEAGFEYYSMS